MSPPVRQASSVSMEGGMAGGGRSLEGWVVKGATDRVAARLEGLQSAKGPVRGANGREMQGLIHNPVPTVTVRYVRGNPRRSHGEAVSAGPGTSLSNSLSLDFPLPGTT